MFSYQRVLTRNRDNNKKIWVRMMSEKTWIFIYHLSLTYHPTEVVRPLCMHNDHCLLPSISVTADCCCWLLANVPATCQCISGMDLLRQAYLLPHWDRSCRPNFPSHPVTVCWHRANQSQHWPYNARRLECQFLSHWYDSTPKKSQPKRNSNPWSSALEADALTTRPMRRSTADWDMTICHTI